ncbi:leucine-rich repeat domain-containing protein [Desulfococcaceae bacterium HSG9]|nr:leucine-rich repeat domain-containing protein [Desulfococcaceae bacterium HSG9]
MTGLPESLGQLTQLQSLNLSKNQLTGLPESLGQLTQLQLLNLSENQLTELPESLGQLTQLQLLNLSENQLTELPESLGQLTQLQSLNLSGNKLTALPESLGQLTQLQSLYLSGNQLTALPESLGQLTQLQSLYLSGNQLTELPELLGQLTQLQSLYLSGNQLTELPELLGQLTQLQSLHLFGNQLTELPELLGQLTQLQSLNLRNNHLMALPESLGQLTQLQTLNLSRNLLTELPESLGQLTQLQLLNININQLRSLPGSIVNLQQMQELTLGDNPLGTIPIVLRGLRTLKTLYIPGSDLTTIHYWIEELYSLEELSFTGNSITDIPASLAQLEHLKMLGLDDNPLNPELAAAYEQGLDAVKAYLRAKAAEQITLNEAKLILIGEGEVGKSCLLAALRGDPFVSGLPTTHGIEIKPVKVTDPESGTDITLNGWDFGGQRVYRPTHQLFFSSPAVYLVAWKPREGPQQGFVKEWITLVKHREPDAKIIVVATHGGPQQRQPDIDRQELWDIFGKDTVLDFFHIESKPDENGNRRGIEELRQAIARVAAGLPEMGRSVPKRWQDVRKALAQTEEAYLSLARVFKLCHDHQMDDDESRLFVTISHRLGHLIHYEHDPALRDIVVLKPDWLSTAVSFVLDDQETRENHGIVSFDRLAKLWNDPAQESEYRYSPDLHPLFLRLMERFDLSYKVSLPTEVSDAIEFWQQFKGIWNKAVGRKDELAHLRYTSLIAQLVPDTRPQEDLAKAWSPDVESGDTLQMQICRIVDERGQSATAEGLFFQLIVRLHKYSLGREDYCNSIHWQRGLMLDDDYNGRALLEHIASDVRITVRAPFPQRFLAMLTEEVKYLVESFWEGLRCDVMVRCLNPEPCAGLFEVRKLIENKRRNHPAQPCPICNEWQNIGELLLNAPDARPVPTEEMIASREVLDELRGLREILITGNDKMMGRFDTLDAGQRELLSKADASYNNLMQALTDEAKEGPRLFSFMPVDQSNFNPKKWLRAKFRLTLWCEHSRLPLPSLNSIDSKQGVYEIELSRDWFKKAAPFLKLLTGTLSLVLPVASSGVKLALDDTAYKAIQEQLDFGSKAIAACIGEGAKIAEFMGAADTTALKHGQAIHAQGSTLRELHALLKAKDPGFGGLVRVMDKRQEFMWVHPQFEEKY